METMPHILVVDDDREIRDLLARFLERHRFRVTAVRDARDARRAWPANHFQLIVLDLMLPGEGGLELTRWMRAQSDVPIVMLTAMGEETDRIIGLELGADDYVPKPFNPRELLARIRAVLRRTAERSERRLENQSAPWHFAGWTLEPTRRRLLNPEQVEVPLTGGEYDLLVALVERANRVLTRDMLLDLLRGRQAGPFDRAIDVAISRLRRKLEDDGRQSQLIRQCAAAAMSWRQTWSGLDRLAAEPEHPHRDRADHRAGARAGGGTHRPYTGTAGPGAAGAGGGARPAVQQHLSLGCPGAAGTA